MYSAGWSLEQQQPWQWGSSAVISLGDAASTVGYRSTIIITTATMVIITVIRDCGFQFPPGAQPRVTLACQVREVGTYKQVGYLWDWPEIWTCFLHRIPSSDPDHAPPLLPPPSAFCSHLTSASTDLTLRSEDSGKGNLLFGVAVPMYLLLPTGFRVWGIS